MATGGRASSDSDEEFERYVSAAAARGLLPPNLDDFGQGMLAHEITTTDGMFTEDEYDECFAPHLQISRGFAFLPVDELDGMARTWPKTGLFRSTNSSFLRGLGVTYFYQSRMLKARELLLRVWETDPDLEVAVMLAECACAIKDTAGESFEKALHRVCVYVGDSNIAITEQHVLDWVEKLDKIGRFMGFFILQYALHRKLMSDLKGKGEPAKATFEMLKETASRVLVVIRQNDLLTTSQSVVEAIDFILTTLKKETDEFPDTLEHRLAGAYWCKAVAQLSTFLVERATK